MQITLEFYGMLQEVCGSKEQDLTVAGEGASVADVLAVLAQQTPAISDHLPRVACARGDQLLSRTARVADGDRLALIPPVSGGCPIDSSDSPSH